MGLLPLVHFLQELLTERLGWSPSRLRASFVVDDPNLHWTSYGFLDYRELVRHAREHGYHLGLATVPLDGWHADRRAAALLAANPGQVSLLMHGNDHVSRELGGLTATSAPPAIAQALRRVLALERRSGVKVERVMAPPHGACSREALEAMLALGLEAACISRPYPWLDGEPPPTALAGFGPAELVAGGMPVLPRVHLSAPREDLALRAFLGQPLVLYGHHGDFSDGLGVLAQAAAEVGNLGEARWERLGAIARASFMERREGEELTVRMHSRLATIEIPAGVRTLRVEVPEPAGGSACHRIRHAAGSAELVFASGLGSSAPIALGDGEQAGTLQLELLPDQPLGSEDVPAPRPRLWPLLRRAAVEGRDRLQPLAARRT